MKKNDACKKVLAAALALGVCLLSGCAPSVDNKQDPLGDYSVDSLLPFDTNQVTPTDTPVPQPEATATISPVDQNWQNDNQVTGGTTASTVQTVQKVPLARLELGSTGEGVQQLQERLIELGYLSGSADGSFGSNTKTAVKRFQAALGLSQTGVATVTLQEKLFLSTAPTYVPAQEPSGSQNGTSASAGESDTGYTTLIRGDKGDGVTALQKRLIALGYLSGSADGSFGTKTENAVKRFQEALGLTQNGVASVSLQQSLFAANAPIAVATAAPQVTQAPTQQPSVGSASTGYTDLEYGDKSDAVKRLQERLKELGYFDHTCTGKYYSETEASVKRFQAALGLTQTGVATASLQTKLFASNAPLNSTQQPQSTQAPTAGSAYTTLSRGSTGEEVRALQKRLKELGYLSSTPDGDFGKNTENAVKLFQQAIGYNVNGVATEAVQEYLFSRYAPAYVAPAATATSAPAQPAEPTQAPQETEYVELRPGDTGEAVKKLQRRLKELGYFNGEIGGNYLTKTTSAVCLFENAIGWNEDGVATVVLQQYLFSDGAPVYDTNVGYASLEKGDSGTQVKALQQRLIELGYLSGKADGDFGSKTKNAVAAFQASIGLDATGVADADTQEYLYAAGAPTAQVTQAPTQAPTQPPETSGYQMLSYGVSGEAVKKLQSRLKELGYFTGNVAGNYKDLTQAAVVAFQQAIGWTADGVATPELQEYLFSASAPANGATGGSSQPDESVGDGSYSALTYGQENAQVKRLQERLIELGWLTDGADGEFGQNTLNAVTALQYRFGMEQTGVATAALQARLFAADAPAYVEYEELTLGMMGEQVLALQARLIELGYLRDVEANLDGEFGEGTRGAVKSVQQAMGLIGEEVDGVASIEFQTFLYSDFALEYKLQAG